jgi:hypothetical protein
MAWTERVAFRVVTVIPTEGYAGQLKHFPMPQFMHQLPANCDGISTRHTEKLIKVALAGGVSQRKFSPRIWRAHHTMDDYQKANDLMAHLVGSQEEHLAWMKLLMVRTDMAIEFYWPHCIALAKALFEQKTMSGRDVKRILDAVQQ